MYCLKCGYKIPAGALFCPNCGAKVQAASPAQPSAVPSGTAQPETDAQLDTGSSEQNEQSTAQTRQEPEGQPEAVPYIGPSVPPVVPQSAQNNAQPAGDPLAAIVGKHADYYLAEFKKIDAGQKSRFNWAAFFLGECMCFYRQDVELFKKYFLLYYILFAVYGIIASVSMVSMAGGSLGMGLIGTALVTVLFMVISVFGLVVRILFGKRFNRLYYNHCKQQLGLPEPERKAGTSAKKMWLFVLAVAGVVIVWSVATSLLSAQATNAYLDSLWEDSSFSENTYSESSSYYDETYDESDSYVEEEPAVSVEETPSLEIGSVEMLESAWATFLANSGEQEITIVGADCDCDGLNEGFGVTAAGQDEMGCYEAKIYFIDSYGNVTLLCDTSPEGGALYGYPSDAILYPDSTDGFFVWDLFTGASDLSLVWGVQNGQVYESDISGQYNGVQLADTWGLAGYQLDYSQGYRNYAIYRLSYDTDTNSFTAIPDSAAYPAGEGPLA